MPLPVEVEPLSFFLVNHELEDIVKDKPANLIDISVEASTAEALRLMSEHNLISLPVYAPQDSEFVKKNDWTLSSGSKNYVGIINILDVAIVLIDETSDRSSDSDINEIVSKVPVSVVLRASRESERLWVGWPGAKLQDALEPLARGVHRMLVPVATSSAEGDVHIEFKMCTQTDVCRFILDNLSGDPLLKSKGISTLSELGLAVEPDAPDSQKTLKRVVGTDKTSSTYDTLRFMAENELRAVAVVDKKQNQFIATLSLSNIRKNLLPLVSKEMTVEEYIKLVHNVKDLQDLQEQQKTCRRTDKLQDVMKKIITGGLHRVWVTDDGEPIGVVSLTDVIQAVIWPKEVLHDEV
ncbi:hypothetical protein HK102_004008 [Quaeritorhiza haematococci]|nr:hypothetical protein HK102_004008 [Quaeritorhiza haematococci]